MSVTSTGAVPGSEQDRFFYRDAVLAYAAEHYGVEPDYPWMDSNCVLRHRENNKWFAAILTAPGKTLGVPDRAQIEVLNLKCEPMMIYALRFQPGYYPAYHMNKENWISVCLDGSVPMEEIQWLMEKSYDMTGIRKKKSKDKPAAEKPE